MENTKSFINLKEVSFPVFRLTNRKPLIQEGIVYYRNSYLVVDDNAVETNIKVIDDTNVPGNTLAHRRLKLNSLGAPLYPIRTAIYFLGDFIKLAKTGYWFIDSTGKLFTYKKQNRASLVCKKISKIIPTKTTGSLIEVHGSVERFRTLFRVPETHRYAQFLIIGKLNIFYGTTETEHKKSWRLI